MNKTLRTFLNEVRELGPEFYVEVSKKLSPNLEVQVIQEKLAKEGRYPVIYCLDITGSKLPLVTNLCGSYEMLGLAMGIDAKAISDDKDKAFLEYWRRGKAQKPVKTISSSSAPIKEPLSCSTIRI